MLEEKKCFSKHANEMFTNYGDFLLRSRTSNYIGMILGLVSLMMSSIFFLIYMGKKNMKYHENTDEDLQLSP